MLFLVVPLSANNTLYITTFNSWEQVAPKKSVQSKTAIRADVQKFSTSDFFQLYFGSKGGCRVSHKNEARGDASDFPALSRQPGSFWILCSTVLSGANLEYRYYLCVYRCWCLCLGMAKQQHADILLYITTTAYTVQEHLSLCVAWRNNCTVFYYFVPQHALTLKGK